MKKYFVLISIILVSFACQKKQDQIKIDALPLLSGPYMGQKPPGMEPELFAPGIVSTGMAELNAMFSPNYKSFYYSIRMPNRQLVIMTRYRQGQKWSAPQVAEFSGKYSDADPLITPDGKWLYFISNRPIDSSLKARKDWDIWRLENIDGKWSEAEHLPSPINTEADETYPSLTQTGTLYFTSSRKGSKGGSDIYSAQKNGRTFMAPTRLDGEVNSNYEGDVFVSPNEDYLIFKSYGRPGGNGLHISFREEGKWSHPKNMGKTINVTGHEYCPAVSPDGKYFFYTSAQTKTSIETPVKLTLDKIKEDYTQAFKQPQRGKSDIYWVDVKILDQYREKRQ